MYISEELENSPVLYYSVALVLVICTIYGMVALFTGEGEKGVFILTIAVPFYVAFYYRLFYDDNHTDEDPRY